MLSGKVQVYFKSISWYYDIQWNLPEAYSKQQQQQQMLVKAGMLFNGFTIDFVFA